MRIKVNDTVRVRGKDYKGQDHKVLSVNLEKNTVTVEGVNEVKRHVRRSQRNLQGGRLSKLMPIPVSKVMLVCPSCQKPTRVGYKFDEETGKKNRVCKKCGAVLPQAPYNKKR